MTNRSIFLVVLAGILLGAASAPSTSSRPAATAPAASAPATSAPATAATTSRPAAARSTLDGVFNDEQVARGKKFYLNSCARCHGDTLNGNDDAVALRGAEFITPWSNKAVSELVEYTRTQMPGDSPGNLPRKEVTDIVVYLLSANGMPAGKAELSSELDELKRVQIQVKK
jgi:mono/diheme cytochrome c family protein